MKKIFGLLVILTSVALSACTSNDFYDDISSDMQSFISEYFPGQAVATVTTVNGDCHVTLDGGPAVVFGANSAWISIDGKGSPLPAVLIFDQTPPKLYDYLLSTQNTANVYCMSRNSKEYVIELLDYTYSYNITTEKVTGEGALEHPDAN